MTMTKIKLILKQLPVMSIFVEFKSVSSPSVLAMLKTRYIYCVHSSGTRLIIFFFYHCCAPT